jgi:hypothetical protein
MAESGRKDDRERVRKRAGHCCEYCRSQERFATQSFAVEHIGPRSSDGTDELDNLAYACQGCSNHKYNKTRGRDPVTGETVPLYDPRRQRWRDHFTWDDTFLLILGITPTGRAAVETPRLNRPGLVNLRRVLYAAGEHPPPESAGETPPEPPAL